MLVKIAAFACLGGYLYGYDLGLISGALAPIKADLGASDFALEIMVGGAKFGAVLGTFLGGAFMLHYGRRLAIGFDSLFFIAGPILMAFSHSILGLTVGRVLVGIGIGVSAVVVPAYLGEVAPASARGRIVEVYEVMLCCGVLMAMLVDAALQNVIYNWRWMVGAPVIPALFLAGALFILPESPRWLVTKGRLDEALAVIHQVFTKSLLPMGSQTSTAEVEQELLELWSSVEKERDAIRETNLQAHQQSVAQRASKGWRGLRLGNHKRWHTLKSEQSSPAGELAQEGQHQVELTRKIDQSDKDLTPSNLEDRQPGSVAQNTTETGSETQALIPAKLESKDSKEKIATRKEEEGSSGERQEEERVEGRHESPIVSPLGISTESSTSDPVHEALSDPASPLYRSLSEIPKNLPPVRTKSEEGLDFEESLSPPKAPRKTSLKRMPSNTIKGEGSFWLCFWNMLKQIKTVAQGEEKEAFFTALILAFVNQAIASSAIINYAPQMIADTGIKDHSTALLLTSTITAAKMSGVILGVALIDSLGRRPLLIWGSASCSAALILLFGGVYMSSTTFEIVAMCAFMLAFNASYAGVFWVLLSELFSMTAKSPAASAATAMMFLAGSLADSLFLSLLNWLGPYCFFVYAFIALLGGIFSYLKVPETRGCTLAEIQLMFAKKVIELPEVVPEEQQPTESIQGKEQGDRQQLLRGNLDSNA